MRTIQPIVAGLSSLGSTVPTKQHAPTGFAPMRRQRPSQQFGLVVPALARSARARGCPGDDVDLGGIESAAELLGEMAGEATAVAELQPDHEFLGQPDELCRGDDARRGDDGRRRHQCEPTPAAQFHPGFPTTSTTIDQHEFVVARGYDIDGWTCCWAR